MNYHYNVNVCLTHAGYDSLVGKYPSRDFASSSKWRAFACFSSPGTEMSPIPDRSSILLTQSSSRGKFAKLSFSVRRFHKGSFFLNAFRFSSASMMLTPPPCICRLRWLRASKISAMYAKMRMNSEFSKQSAWQCWYSRKNRANSTRMAKTRFSTFRRDNHRTLEWYRSTSNSEPISLHSSLKMRCFIANTCLCRTKGVTMMCGASDFTSAPKPECCPSMAGALSEQTAETIFHKRSLSLKKSSTSFFTSTALVVVIKNLPLARCLSQAHKYNKLA